ncbi:unnamed protein product [Rhodiola kirilowii]
MSALVWNYRGIGGAVTVRTLINLVRVNHPLVVGLLETKAGKARMERIQREIGFRNGFVVESRGRSGGLVLWWKAEIDLSIRSYSDFHIEVVVEGSSPFRFTLFYGHPVSSKREETCDLPRRLKNLSDLPWIVVGDFNEVLFGWEVQGRILRGEWQMRKFTEGLQDFCLIDLSFRGSQFTFSNRRKGVYETKARLDRALASQNWRFLFSEAEVLHKVATHSDHAPLVVKWKGGGRSSRLNLFRFESMWLKHKEFAEVVSNIWSDKVTSSCRMFTFLKYCAEGIDTWSRRKLCRVKDKMACLKRELWKIRELERTEEVVAKEANLSSELDEWLLREELYWKQRSRVDWMREVIAIRKFST